MEHVIRRKRTLLIIGASEADVHDFVGGIRALAVPRELWPMSERFDTTGCTPDDIPEDRFASRCYDAVIVTKRAVGCDTVPVMLWRWQEPDVLQAQPPPADRRITGVTCNYCGDALDPGDLPAALAHSDACAKRPAARAVVRMAPARTPVAPTPEELAEGAARREKGKRKNAAARERVERLRPRVERLRPRVEEEIRRITGSGAVSVYPNTLIIDLFESEAVLTFDKLAELAAVFGTRKINLGASRGFGGSDVTPPDSDTATVTIEGWTLPEERP